MGIAVESGNGAASRIHGSRKVRVNSGRGEQRKTSPTMKEVTERAAARRARSPPSHATPAAPVAAEHRPAPTRAALAAAARRPAASPAARRAALPQPCPPPPQPPPRAAPAVAERRFRGRARHRAPPPRAASMLRCPSPPPSVISVAVRAAVRPPPRAAPAAARLAAHAAGAVPATECTRRALPPAVTSLRTAFTHLSSWSRLRWTCSRMLSSLVPMGPLVDLEEEEKAPGDCSGWLDTRSPRCVVYASRGSFAEEVAKMAHRLASTEG
ncbi:hypothetical protein BRADI_4g08085v3 [Brachypodium distachyon]|uniref:Uncharacterized protein n=1 Tax=Brachypodium distachyon TaxID=15368 RepID=A0A0Q3PCG2_BRADI|nr:hypothetical protein BRADI_4g08085v3 [Brachypodium distachyon]